MTARYGTTVDIFGVNFMVTDYADATSRIIEAARGRRSFGVSALAVHGLIEAVEDEGLRAQVNSLDMVTPDGQPVRWAMNALHGAGLQERVYGPDLTWHVLEAAAAEEMGVFLFGSTETTCEAFSTEIRRRYPSITVTHQPDRFRDATLDEDACDVAVINESGAAIVLVGRGCPRQERWVADHRGRVHAAMLAVGAAFDYGAGSLAPPPEWMQRIGLQWLFRLIQEPKRLWRRYLLTNSRFLLMFGLALRKRPKRASAAGRRADGP
jgi:N-acetylglucosaminyldiphosphoundecaprenol N-acetyl-beta-D-mannosaminyltransferase